MSLFNATLANIAKLEEIVVFTRVNEGEYYFDGKQLIKEFDFIIANNSQVNISIVDISLNRAGERKKLNYSDTRNNLPINLSSGYSINQKVYIIEALEQK